MESILQGPFGRKILWQTPLTIGHAQDNQLVLSDPRVSGHHAEIRPNGQGYTITDLGSTNGTFVNGQRLDRNVPCILNNGDRISMGDTVFTYKVETAGATEVSPGGYSIGNSSPYAPTVAAGSFENTAYGPNAPTYAPPPPTYPSGGSVQQGYAPPPYVEAPYPPLPPYQPIPPQEVGGPGTQKPLASFPSRLLLIILAAVVILGGGGGFLLYHFLTLPQPVMTVTSNYHAGSTPAGSTGTTLHVSGQKFSSNSTITFLLDGVPVPGNATAQSDANGNVTADLKITADWAQGPHMLTATDAGGFKTKEGQSVVIVAQGQANTPGPNGAPPDDMSFKLTVTVQQHDVKTGQSLSSFTETLIITGQPDPAGGTVCQSVDNGQPQNYSGTLNSGAIRYREALVTSCSGTYKGGKLSYTETASSDRYDLSDGTSCSVNAPYVAERLVGTFSSSNTISGDYSSDAITAPCADGTQVTFDATAGTWTATLT